MAEIRLKSEIWVSAFLRRHQGEGRFGAVIHKGAPEAGAVYVAVNHLDGSFHLFGPAAGPGHDAAGDRRWHLELAPPSTQADVDTLIARRRRFDPDIWVIEVEDKTGTAGLAPDLP